MKPIRSHFPEARMLWAFATMLAWPASADTAPTAASQSDRLAIRRTGSEIAAGFRSAYIYPDKGDRAATALEQALAAKTYDDLVDRDEFIRRITADLRSFTNDQHIFVVRNLRPPGQAASPQPNDAGFERVERLEGNIGYIRLIRFAPPEIFHDVANNAMRLVADTNALIFDIRGNRGGHPRSVAYLSSFLLDPARSIHLASAVWRNKGTLNFRTEEFWTSQTPGHYLDKPVYILVGPETFSAGEGFAYHLQALRRATIIGAKTKGGAHATEPDAVVAIEPDLFLVAPNGRTENPVTKSNWDGVGVRPDVEVPPEAALDAAMQLALARQSASTREGAAVAAQQQTAGAQDRR